MLPIALALRHRLPTFGAKRGGYLTSAYRAAFFETNRLPRLFRKIDGNLCLRINRHAILDVWVVAPRFDNSQGCIA